MSVILAVLMLSMGGTASTIQLNSMAHAEALAVPAPTAGMFIFDPTHKNIMFYDGTVWVDIPSIVPKSYTFSARSATSGIYYLGGHYDILDADVTLDQGTPTNAFGAANHPHAAHAILVAEGNGTTDGSDLIVTVSGTSITDGGTRTGGDSEVIIGAGADVTACQINATAAATHLKCETTKKWIGTATYTLTSAGGGTFDFTFNLGLAKYDDLGNRDFTLTDLECTGLANASDSDFDIELLKHEATGWTYHATAFVPGNTLYQLTTIYGAESDTSAGAHIAFKRTGISEAVDGADSEGFMFRITTGSNNSLSYLNCHVMARF